MHFDALTLACITNELNQRLVPGRAQQVLLPDEHSVGLEVYANRKRHHLLLSANPKESRVHLSSQKLRRGVKKETPLLLLMRKYLRGSLLATIEQPDPTERILHLAFEHPEHGNTILVFEPMGQRSNLLLIEPSGRILECLRRVRPTDSKHRLLLPNKPYTPPPPQARFSPLDDGSSDYYADLYAFLQVDQPLWKVLLTQIAGISPTLGREIAYRATGAVDTPANEVNILSLAQSLQALWSPVRSGEWHPSIWQEDGVGRGFAAYIATWAASTAEVVGTDSMSEALEQFYATQSKPKQKSQSEAAQTSQNMATKSTDGTRKQAGGPSAKGDLSPDAYATVRRDVANALRQSKKRIGRQLGAIAKDEPAPGEPALLRVKAEWLLALSSQIEPEQKTLVVELDGEALEIVLDTKKTPVEQAERMFDRAAKLERAAQIIPERRATLNNDLAFIEQLETDLMLAENQPDIAAVEDEVRKAGFLPKAQRVRDKAQKRSSNRSQPMRYRGPGGIEIIVGRNANQNEIVTFNLAHADDLWLHARGAPGSHVVIRCGTEGASDELIESAAQLAGHYSRLRGERAAPVIVAQRRFVTRVPGGRAGQVYVRNEQVVTVLAELPEDAILEVA